MISFAFNVYFTQMFLLLFLFVSGKKSICLWGQAKFNK